MQKNHSKGSWPNVSPSMDALGPGGKWIEKFTTFSVKIVYISRYNLLKLKLRLSVSNTKNCYFNIKYAVIFLFGSS